MRLPDVPSSKAVSLSVWSDKISHFLKALLRELETPGPKVVQLEHKLATASASIDGVLMYDPIAGTMVLSKNGAWYPVSLGAPVATGIRDNRRRNVPGSANAHVTPGP